MATSSRSERPGRREPRRRLHPTERRRELLDAAIAVLKVEGPAGARVEDVTSAAGTAKGNFYRYFASMDDLLVAVRDHLLDQYFAAAAERLPSGAGADWWQVVVDETRRFLDYQHDLGPLHDVLFHSPAPSARPIAPQRAAGGMVTWVIEAGVEQGAFSVDDPETAGELLFHTVHGAADLVRDGADRARVEPAVLEVIRRALGVTTS